MCVCFTNTPSPDPVEIPKNATTFYIARCASLTLLCPRISPFPNYHRIALHTHTHTWHKVYARCARKYDPYLRKGKAQHTDRAVYKHGLALYCRHTRNVLWDTQCASMRNIKNRAWFSRASACARVLGFCAICVRMLDETAKNRNSWPTYQRSGEWWFECVRINVHYTIYRIYLIVTHTHTHKHIQKQTHMSEWHVHKFDRTKHQPPATHKPPTLHPFNFEASVRVECILAVVLSVGACACVRLWIATQ